METASCEHVTCRSREVKKNFSLWNPGCLLIEIMTHASMQHMGTPERLQGAGTSLLLAPCANGHGVSKNKIARRSLQWRVWGPDPVKL